MASNFELLNDFCEAHGLSCTPCAFFPDRCPFDDENKKMAAAIFTLMSMVREDCEPNDWLKGLRPSHDASLDFELEEELGKE